MKYVSKMRKSHIIKTLLIVATIAVVAAIIFMLYRHQNTPTPENRIIETEIVRVVTSGNTITITEIPTDTIRVFTRRHVIRRNNSPAPAPRTAVRNTYIEIRTYRGVIVVIERETGVVHIV